MSKYDQNIKDFILKKKEVSFEKIGFFSVVRPIGDEKTVQTHFVDFQYNKKAQTTDELIDFIVKETGKNRTLISSDLSSLFEDARQYVNIGKTFVIAGLGTLFLNRAGEYAFTPAQGSIQGGDPAGNNTFKKGTEKPVKKIVRRNAVIFAAFLIILLITAGLAWGIYKYINQQKNDASATSMPENTGDSGTVKQNKTSDSVNNQPALHPPALGDSVNYRFIFLTTVNRYRAENRYDSLKKWGEHVYIDSVKSDTLTLYHLFIRAKLTAKDTAYVRDSIQKYFQRPTKIATN